MSTLSRNIVQAMRIAEQIELLTSEVGPYTKVVPVAPDEDGNPVAMVRTIPLPVNAANNLAAQIETAVSNARDTRIANLEAQLQQIMAQP